MTKGLISEIIPCYNVEKWLDDCFETLKNQTYQNVEYIFVDDGSTDGTLEKLETMAKQLGDKARVLHKENGGVSSARNFGLAHANGEFIHFYDPDDVYHKDLLSILHENLIKSGCDVVSSRHTRVDEDFKYSQIKDTEFHGTEIVDNKTAIKILACRCKEIRFACWSKLYKQDILKKFKNYPNVFDANINYNEDGLFNFDYFVLCKKICLIKQSLYYYRQSKGSYVNCKFNENKLTSFVGMDKMIDYCTEHNEKEVLDYVVMMKCLYIYEFLNKILLGGGYYNKKKIDEMYKYYMKNIKVIRRCKLSLWHTRYLQFLGLFFIKFFINIKLLFKK